MSSSRLLAVGVLLVFERLAFAAQIPPLTTDSPITRDSPSNYDFYVADQFTYDDNLYRLPSYIDVATLAGPQATRQDGFNSVSLGGDGRWFSSNQVIGVNVRADDNRFIHNGSLDNISGKGNVEWDWRLETRWSGQAGFTYNRSIANPANTGYYALDMVAREDYFGSIRYQVGPHWALYGGAIGADTSHTAVAEQPYDFRSKAGNAGIEYATSSENSIGLDYRFTDATFPQEFELNGAPFNSNYNEDTTRIVLKYVFSAATELDASVGYLKRDYPQSGFATFSGDIWRAALQWQPTDYLQFVATGWHELGAYVDAESDYFVSNGASVAPAWIATDTLTLSLSVSRETHDYIGSSPSAITLVSRRDRLTLEQARLIYAPLDSLTFNFTYRFDRHESNQPRYQYDDTLATASVTFKIRP